MEPLLRHKSSLPLSSPKQVGKTTSLTKFTFDLNGTGKRFSFNNKPNQSREESKDNQLKTLGSKEDYSTDSIILPDEYVDRRLVQNEFRHQNQTGQNEILLSPGSKIDFVNSLWDLPEINDLKPHECNVSLGNCGLTHMPSHDRGNRAL